MKKLKRIAILSALTILGLGAQAQDTRTDNHQITIVVPDVALLDLEATSKNFTTTFVQPTPLEAGERLTNPSNNTDLWLNYSSIIPSTVTSRRVDVSTSALVPGVDVGVTAGSSSTGFGTKGTPTSEVTLTAAAQPIINGIGSAYTVSGVSKGHQLTYTFKALDANYANLRAASTPITVTYTLVDN